VNGGDYRLTLSIVRILVLIFLALGFVKASPDSQSAQQQSCTRPCGASARLLVLALTRRAAQVLAALCGQCSRRASGRRGAGCASASISLVQGAQCAAAHAHAACPTRAPQII
jgi:hypothetical protein